MPILMDDPKQIAQYKRQTKGRDSRFLINSKKSEQMAEQENYF